MKILMTLCLLGFAAFGAQAAQSPDGAPVRIVKYSAGPGWQDLDAERGSALDVKIANVDSARTVASVMYELKIRDAMRQVVVDTLYCHTDGHGADIRYNLAPGFETKRWVNLSLGYVSWPSRYDTSLRVTRVKFTDGSEWTARELMHDMVHQ